MNISVISIYPFPEGLAPTNRIKAYSKGVIHNGANVNVIIPFPTDRYSDKKVTDRGVVNGIPFAYSSGVYKSKHKLFRTLSVLTRYRRFVGFVSSYRLIHRQNRKNKIDCLILSSDAIDMLFVYSIVAKSIKSKLVFIFDEYPIPIRHKLKTKIPLWKTILYRYVLKGVDAYVSISDNLKDYFCNLCNKPTFILSSITDADRFAIDPEDVKDRYFCYMGNMELTKDNVDLIVRAYSQLPESIRKDYKLFLYGAPNQINKDTILGLISELNLETKVLFKGRVSFNEVPRILKNASVLLSSQPNTLRAQGGFPTKLGEYLASGTPTLLTDVGENSVFVNNREHVFFAKAGSVDDYATQIVYIMENYNIAIQIAEEGKRYVDESYSHVQQGRKLLSFLESL